MNVAVLTIIKDALRYCGQSELPGRGISDTMRDEVLRYLNQWIDSFNLRSLAIYNQQFETFPLVVGQQDYTIGPSATDFDTARPIRIEVGNILLTTGGVVQRLPMTPLNDEQWAAIPVPAIAGIPTKFYYNEDYSDATPGPPGLALIKFYPYPNQALDYEQVSWKALPDTLAFGDTLYVPPGYPRAITLNLAVEIAPLYWKRAQKALLLVQKQAAEARAWLVASNSLAGKLQTDVPRIGPVRPYFNYHSGNIT